MNPEIKVIEDIRKGNKSLENNLLTCLYPLCDKTYKKFNFMNIDEETFKSLFFREVKRTIYNMDLNKISNVTFKKYFSCLFQNKLFEYASKLTELGDYSVVTNYINSNCKNTQNKEEILKNLNSLSLLLKKINCFNEKVLLGAYKESRKLRTYIVQILNELEDNELDVLKNNEYLWKMLSFYFELNNIYLEDDIALEIPVNEEEEENISTEYDTNLVKQYFKEIGKYKILTVPLEKELFIKYKNGDMKARELLINSNLRLVASIARKYLGRGISYMDLIQAGNLGLIDAVENFDVDRGFRFTTFATARIIRPILQEIEKHGRNIKLPNKTYTDIQKLTKITRELTIDLKREPTLEELAQKMDKSVTEIAELKLIKDDTVSLNKSVTEEDDAVLLDFIKSDENVEEQVMISSVATDLMDFINSGVLEPREREVITYRYGLNGKTPLQLEEIGKILNISRQRVCVIEQKALKKLRIAIKRTPLKELDPTKTFDNREQKLLRFDPARFHNNKQKK
jgi:RNA polymerase sigma factor, sigma-70 family